MAGDTKLVAIARDQSKLDDQLLRRFRAQDVDGMRTALLSGADPNVFVAVGFSTASFPTGLLHALLFTNREMFEAYRTGSSGQNRPWYTLPPPDEKTRAAMADVILSDARFDPNRLAPISARRRVPKSSALAAALEKGDATMVRRLLEHPAIKTTDVSRTALEPFLVAVAPPAPPAPRVASGATASIADKDTTPLVRQDLLTAATGTGDSDVTGRLIERAPATALADALSTLDPNAVDRLLDRLTHS